MAMDEWLKGVIAGSAAVLISTALSMRTTEKLIKEAEIDFANPEFGVTPAEDFTDSTRQNLSVGGYTFNAESPSGDDPMMADPTEEGGPAELFDESVVQDEQDGGVDFMNAESPLEESPLTADPSTAEPSDMGGPEDFSAETQAQAASMMSSHVVPAPLGRGVEFDLGAENSDAQLVTIDNPVMTGAKMALGVVALNATALIGISLIGMAIGASVKKMDD